MWIFNHNYQIYKFKEWLVNFICHWEKILLFIIQCLRTVHQESCWKPWTPSQTQTPPLSAKTRPREQDISPPKHPLPSNHTQMCWVLHLSDSQTWWSLNMRREEIYNVLKIEGQFTSSPQIPELTHWQTSTELSQMAYYCLFFYTNEDKGKLRQVKVYKIAKVQYMYVYMNILMDLF